MAFADEGASTFGAAGVDEGAKFLGGRKAFNVAREVGSDLFVGVDDLVDEVGAGTRVLAFAGRAGGRGENAFEAKRVGVGEQANERLLVVGVAADVGGDEKAGAGGGAHGEEGGERDAAEVHSKYAAGRASRLASSRRWSISSTRASGRRAQSGSAAMA